MRKDYSVNPSTCIYENGKYLKSIADTSVIVCDEMIIAIDEVSTNVTNTIPTNMTNTISANVTSTAIISMKKIEIKNGLLYFAHVFISDHITIHNRYYFL